MNAQQFTDLILVPTLRDIPKGYTPEAVMAEQMIVAHESKGGEFITQVGGGPARGIGQIEGPTYETVWQHGDTVWTNALKAKIIGNYDHDFRIVPPIDRLLWDLKFNVFMIRQRLFMFPAALPTTPEAMAEYLKKYWNTEAGAATPEKYLKDWETWLA